MTAAVTFDDINEARRRLGTRVSRTPLIRSHRLSDATGANYFLKAESLQVTGSFKVRGALNAMIAATEREPDVRGFVTFSAGNHGAAVARAGTILGRPTVACMPTAAVKEKIASVVQHGGEVVLADDVVARCHEIAAARDFRIIHPYDDADVIAGQGTVGLELAEDLQHETAGGEDLAVLVPVGGGGLIAGIAVALRALLPAGRLVGLETDTANCMTLGLAAGHPVPLSAPAETTADGLAAPFAGELSLQLVRDLVDEVRLISEHTLDSRIGDVLTLSGLVLEPAACVPIAASLMEDAADLLSPMCVAIASGSNISRQLLSASTGG